jgi:hypothetical protein
MSVLAAEVNSVSDNSHDSLPVFENDEWMKRLEGRIVGLGELYGTQRLELYGSS